MITDAIANAYHTMRKRNWDTIYWAIDLHGVCLESNYKAGAHQFISITAIETLRLISAFPESRIILWSSVHEKDKAPILELFTSAGIRVHGFNANPTAPDTETAAFHEKFYFSILLDDKAGFNPHSDWDTIYYYLINNYKQLLEN